ncbi:MAG: hypothetical protein GEV11_08270 [Streptosporangiales bacterium]|nr:hypothetical protein [Streptosporangiales bacterium]
MIVGSIAAFLGYMSTLVWWMGGWEYSAMAWAQDAQPLAGLLVGTVGLLLAILSRAEWRQGSR